VGRNALNSHASSYAAEVVVNTDAPEHLHQQLQAALVRHDAWPTSRVAKSLMSAAIAPSESVAVMERPGRALTIAQHLSAHRQPAPKRLAVIVNNGFPEVHHNAPAIAICQRFAMDTGMIWLGGLALAAGEAVIGGQPLEGAPQSERPPIQHVIQALDIASVALADGQTIPSEANRLLAKTPIPFMPFGLWRWLFIRLAHQHWRQEAAGNQVSEEALFAQPYAEV